MTDKNDASVKDFLHLHKTNVSDDGFTQKVMNTLPRRKRDFDWIVVVFTFLGMVLSLFLVDVEEALAAFYQTLTHIPYYYYLAFIAAFPLAFLSVFYIKKGKLF